MIEPAKIELENVPQVAQDVADNNANLKPEEIAANFFKTYYPVYKGLVSRLSKKDVMRLADALIGFPLEVNEPKFFGESGKKAFWIANQLLDCKLIMRSAVELDIMNEAMEKTKDINVSNNDNNDTVNEGETNNG